MPKIMRLIFHLEDDSPLREIFRISLKAADPDITVQQFKDSDSGMQYIEDNLGKISLYVLDIRVPGERDGVGVARYIRELGSTRPVIITSAFEKPDTKILRALDCLWMPKPWHIMNIQRKLLPLVLEENQ
jgi:DNA-binding NtrC family response regulator